jgi:hypothetical protein
MSVSVVFFISGHGFGHASREVEVIHALARARPGLRIILRTAVSPSLLSRRLDVQYELRPGACDAAIVQPSSITQDDEATVREMVAFYGALDARVADEVRALAAEDVALIVGDIPPLAFEVARELAVPGVAISNFTWDWILETHPGMSEAAPWLTTSPQCLRARHAGARTARSPADSRSSPRCGLPPRGPAAHARRQRHADAIRHSSRATGGSAVVWRIRLLRRPRSVAAGHFEGNPHGRWSRPIAAPARRDAAGRHLHSESNSLRLDSVTRISSPPRT